MRIIWEHNKGQFPAFDSCSWSLIASVTGPGNLDLKNLQGGTCLAVQWLRVWASTARSPSSVPSRGLRSHMPHGMAKNKWIKCIHLWLKKLPRVRLILSQSLGTTVLCNNHVNGKTASLLLSADILPSGLISSLEGPLVPRQTCKVAWSVGVIGLRLHHLTFFFFPMASAHQNNQNFMEIICCEKAGWLRSRP